MDYVITTEFEELSGVVESLHDLYCYGSFSPTTSPVTSKPTFGPIKDARNYFDSNNQPRLFFPYCSYRFANFPTIFADTFTLTLWDNGKWVIFTFLEHGAFTEKHGPGICVCFLGKLDIILTWNAFSRGVARQKLLVCRQIYTNEETHKQSSKQCFTNFCACCFSLWNHSICKHIDVWNKHFEFWWRFCVNRAVKKRRTLILWIPNCGFVSNLLPLHSNSSLKWII